MRGWTKSALMFPIFGYEAQSIKFQSTSLYINMHFPLVLYPEMFCFHLLLLCFTIFKIHSTNLYTFTLLWQLLDWIIILNFDEKGGFGNGVNLNQIWKVPMWIPGRADRWKSEVQILIWIDIVFILCLQNSWRAKLLGPNTYGFLAKFRQIWHGISIRYWIRSIWVNRYTIENGGYISGGQKNPYFYDCLAQQ